MKNGNTSTVLTEHNKIISVRYILALVNFLAILAGSVVTYIFMSIRGIAFPINIVAVVLIGINVVQIVLCLVDYIAKRYWGVYIKALAPVSYSVGGLWLLVLLTEIALMMFSVHVFRMDVLYIGIVQIVTALVAYLVWPMLNRRALDVMMRRSVRDDEEKRAKKAKSYVVKYALICAALVILQAGTLLLYKVPPQIYDLFENSRGLEYELSSDKRGYIVTDVYVGTSPVVNVPATFNNMPVVGIKSGAIDDTALRESEKIRYITFGTPTADEDGNESVLSYLEFIESGAIINDQIETLTIPASVVRIGGTSDGAAITSKSLKTIVYEASADFEIANYECSSLQKVTMSGTSVGAITSIEGLSAQVTIEVSKDIYNLYRRNNIKYAHNFSPLLESGEFCVDFYTDCDVYIDSVIASTTQTMEYNKLQTLAIDTSAYNADHFELGTNGAKEDSAFRGWYTDSAFITEYPIETDSTLTFNKSMELYAKWVHEYTADLDWGNYVPSGVRTVQHWTDERTEDFPVYKDRIGYSQGVNWHVNNTSGEVVSDTRTLHKNVSLKAEWLLDAPVGVDIAVQRIESSGHENDIYISEDSNLVSFVYDEDHSVRLIPEKQKHPLEEDKSGNNSVTYTYEWYKSNGSRVDVVGELLELQNVADGDVYTLRVIATAVQGGESSYSDSVVTVTIRKKSLNISNYLELNNKTDAQYSGQIQSIAAAGKQGEDLNGFLSENHLRVSYAYYGADGVTFISSEGVRNAGSYRVVATFNKSSEADRANYAEETLEANFVIQKKALTQAEWEIQDSAANGDHITYDGTEKTILLIPDATEILGSDSVNFIYEAGSNVKKAAGTYRAVVTGIDNQNYSYDAITNTERAWYIDQRTLNVGEWLIDGQSRNTVTYSGTAHSVAATYSGRVAGDDVDFIYDEALARTRTNVGSYSATIIGVTNGNYKISDVDQLTFGWSIEKKILTVNIDDPTLTYNGTAQGVTATVSGFVNQEDATLFEYNFFSYTADNLTVSGEANATTYEIYFRAVNAASYSVELTGLNAGLTDEALANYELATTSASRDFQIQRQNLSFEPVTSYTYNGAEQKLLLRVSGFVASDLTGVNYSQFTTNAIGGEIVGGFFCLTYTEKDAQSYPATVEDFTNTNYHMTAYSGSITIAKKSISISSWKILDESKQGATEQTLVNGSAFAYNFNGYTVSAVVSGAVGDDEVLLSLQSYKGVNAGSYTTQASLPSSYSNYSLTGSSSITWEITPYTLNFTWQINGAAVSGSNPNYTYNGSDFTPAAVYEALGTDTVVLTYGAIGTDATAKRDVGNYVTEVTGVDNGNYSIGTNAALSWQIRAATVTVTFKSPGTLVYNGQYQGPEFTISGVMKADQENARIAYRVTGNSDKSAYLIYSGESYSLTGNNGVSVNAGSYTVTITAIYKGSTVDGNYTIASTGSGITYTIGQKELTLSGNWSYSNSNAQPANGIYTEQTRLIYNTGAYTLTTSIASGVVNHLGNSSEVTLTYSGNIGTDAAQNLTARVAGLSGTYAANYKLPSENLTVSWMIEQKTVCKFVWNADGFTYNGTAQRVTATYQTGATGDGDGLVYNGDSLSLTYANNEGTDAKSYAARITGLGNNNYTFSESDATATHTWTIAPRPVTLVWNDVNLVYNGAAQYATATYRDTNNKSVAVTSYSFPQNAINVGSYTIAAISLNDSNYTLSGGTNVSTTYNIAARPIELIWSLDGSGADVTSQELIYTGTTRTLTAAVSNLCNSDTLTLSYDKTTEILNAGSYTFKVTSISGSSANNYTISGANTSIVVTVAKQTVTIAWAAEWGVANTSIVFDGTSHNNGIKATWTGKQGTQTITQDCALSSSGEARNVGAYTFNASIAGIYADNFTFASNAATSYTLNITKKQVALEWSSVYGSPNTSGLYVFTYSPTETYSVAATITNLAAGDVATITYTGSVSNNYGSSSIIGNAAQNAGVYGITASGIAGTNAGNYTLDGASDLRCAMQIDRQGVIVSWNVSGNNSAVIQTSDGYSLVYDGTAHSLIATVTGAKSNVAVTFNYATDQALTNVGSYVKKVVLTNNNYTLDGAANQTCTLRITPATVVADWGATSVTYDGNMHGLTPTLTDITNSKTVEAANYTVTGNKGTNVNSSGYIFTLTLANENYWFSNDVRQATETLYITPVTARVDWGTTEFVYDGAVHVLTPTVYDTVNGSVIDSANWVFNGQAGSGEAGSHSYTITLVSANYLFGNGTSSESGTMVIKEAAAASVAAYDAVLPISKFND